MKLFSCSSCGHTLYFNNVSCIHCGHQLGFDPERLDLMAFEVLDDGSWTPANSDDAKDYFRPCANYAERGACNWVVPASDLDQFCFACRLNQTIPDLSVPENVERWRRLQFEKARLLYSLLRLHLPVTTKKASPQTGLAFDFLGAPNPRFREDSSVLTGYAAGLITLDIAEADDEARERARHDMAEPYRTILGHFRHESGHYYWERLTRDGPRMDEFRTLFGDESVDYDAALQQHYAAGPPAAWHESFVSAYASSHPWEDWAETWAHYLHMVDTLDTAWQFGLHLAPQSDRSLQFQSGSTPDPYQTDDFAALAESWPRLTVALNSLNQSMGQPDAYPFVLTAPVFEKLRLVHDIIRDNATGLLSSENRPRAGITSRAP